MTDLSMFTEAWWRERLSDDGQQAVETFLELWNGGSRLNVQGRPIPPIGVQASRYREEDRHLMFKNDSGLVPTHMPWIIKDAVEWMEKHPCKSNLVPSVEENATDHYGRNLKGGTIDMKFRYLAEGREVGAMTIQDFWFETRCINDTRGFGQIRRLDVMVTTFTAKKEEDPYNGTGGAGQP
eukprot:3922624-Amphidinium_carterae.1